MSETIPVEAIQDVECFTLDCEEKVNWLLRKLANIEAEKTRITTQYRTMLKTLEAEARGLHYRFDDDLKTFTANRLAEQGNRRKSVHLLQGTLSFCSVPQKLKIVDADAALEWAKSHFPEAVNLTESLDTEQYHQRVKDVRNESGEILPGAALIPEHEAFRVSFGKTNT